ncbi:hypothetical protein QTP86_003339 [Hemibagrus guttatus]|nr:hypothetical protein QTP86_003339 [Hemibagrus guttatus]
MKKTTRRKEKLVKNKGKKDYNKEKLKKERAAERKGKEKRTTLIITNKQWNRTLNGQKRGHRTVLILFWVMWRDMGKERWIKMKKQTFEKKIKMDNMVNDRGGKGQIRRRALKRDRLGKRDAIGRLPSSCH